MTKLKSTRNALVASIVVLALCFSMLIGTTFAWFTDSASSTNNVIKSGTLKIEFQYYDGAKWQDVDGASDIISGDLWEPGYTDVAYLRIKNTGTLALQYALGINIANEKTGVNRDGESFKLSDYIYFGVENGRDGKANPYATRDDAVSVATPGKKISTGYSSSEILAPNSEYTYFALVVCMPETVGNVAAHNGVDVPYIDLGINIFATQVTAEKDSYNEFYDKDAAVSTVADAMAIMNKGKDVVLLNCDEPNSDLVIPAGYTGKITLFNVKLNSITEAAAETEANLVVMSNVTVINNTPDSSAISATYINISGNGNLVAIGNGKAGFGIGGMNTKSITIKDLTVNDVKGGYYDYVDNIATDKYLKAAPEGGAAIGSGLNGATVTIDNATIINAIGGSKAAAIGARFWTGVNVKITNSTIAYAKGGASAAAIGGSRVNCTEPDYTIEIRNSNVTAIGGTYAAGIGTAYDSDCRDEQPLCTLTIVDSTINAKGGTYAAGVGTGFHTASIKGDIVNSTVNAVSGTKFYKKTYTNAQDIGFGVVDPTREGLQRDSYINYNGKKIEMSLPVDNLDDLNEALKNGTNVSLKNNILIELNQAQTAPYGNKTALIHKGGTFDGAGNEVGLNTGADHYTVMTSGGTITNLKVTSGFRGIMIMDPTETIYIDKVYIGGSTVGYALNTGEGDGTQDLIVTDSEFYGWNSWSLIKSATFTNCTFGQGTYWGSNSIYGRIARPYVDTVFTNCDFNAVGYILDISSLNGTINLVNCRLNGVEITAENFDTLVDLTDLTSGDKAGVVNIAKVMVNGVLVFDEANP